MLLCFCSRNLHDLLADYDVELPAEIKTMINRAVFFHGSYKASEGPVATQPPLPDVPLTTHKVTLQLAVSTTRNDLSQLLAKLREFLKLIHPYVGMLVGLRHNHIFRQYLKLEQQKTACLSISATEQSSSLIQLHSSLSRVAELLRQLIKGSSITYKQVTAEGSLNLERLNLREELFEIGHFFPECPSETSYSGIRSILELIKFAQHIARIRDVCTKYKLENCLDDSELQELVVIHDEIQNDELRANMKLHNAVQKRETIIRNLCLQDASGTRCLQVFKLIADCMEFFIFVQEKFFRFAKEDELESSTSFETFPVESALATFQQLFEIITQQLQHEDYNEQVLNQLHRAFRFILPFMDYRQTFRSLMTSVVQLDSSSEFEELRTATENINLIRLWFSRAEVSKFTSSKVILILISWSA